MTRQAERSKLTGSARIDISTGLPIVESPAPLIAPAEARLALTPERMHLYDQTRKMVDSSRWIPRGHQVEVTTGQ